MTMDYLVTHIMDKGEGNYREWYDFVWNRTRGIRKVTIKKKSIVFHRINTNKRVRLKEIKSQGKEEGHIVEIAR